MFPSCKTLLVWVYCFECVIHLVESSLSPQPGHIYQEVDLIPGVVNTAYELSVVNGTHSAVQFLLSSDDIDFSVYVHKISKIIVLNGSRYASCPVEKK